MLCRLDNTLTYSYSSTDLQSVVALFPGEDCVNPMCVAIGSFSVGDFTHGDPKPPAMVLKSKLARQAQAGSRLFEV